MRRPSRGTADRDTLIAVAKSCVRRLTDNSVLGVPASASLRSSLAFGRAVEGVLRTVFRGARGRFPEQGAQIASHRIHTAWLSPRRHVAVGPDQHGRPGAVVTRSGRLRNVARNDVQVFAVEPQRGIV